MHKYVYDLDLSTVEEIFTSWEEPDYRAIQFWKGLYQQYWQDPEQFTTFPLELRDRLADEFSFSHLDPVNLVQSSDLTTQKALFRLPDGQAIETVLMHYEDRNTVCISSQAGCAMGCDFCATGQMGFRRQLSSGEIVEQVVYYARHLEAAGERLTNIVFMGMGEPFHNYQTVMESIERMQHDQGMNIGARRFTISTVGLVPMIRKFAREDSQVNLAISLHAVDDELRSSMMPINDKYPVAELISACRDYVESTNRRITFEWALIQGVNDSPRQAQKLASLIGDMISHVNVIPLNPTEGFEGQATTEDRARRFQSVLIDQGIPCTIRQRRGIDINAGCGQLASEHENS